MAYIDGFVIPVPKDRLDNYKDHGPALRHGVEGAWRPRPPSNAWATTCPMAS